MPRILIRHVGGRRLFDPKAFEREIRSELNQHVKPEVLGLYRETVEGWKNKPTSFARVNVGSNQISLDAGPSSGKNKDLYQLVSKGAKPHRIPKVGRKRMTFQTGYVAATTPGKIKSSAASFSGPSVTAFSVNHPGFEGRDFHNLIAEEVKPEFRRRIKNAIERAVYRYTNA